MSWVSVWKQKYEEFSVLSFENVCRKKNQELSSKKRGTLISSLWSPQFEVTDFGWKHFQSHEKRDNKCIHLNLVPSSAHLHLLPKEKKKKKHEHIIMTVKTHYSQNYKLHLAFSHLKTSKILGAGSSSWAGPRQLPLGCSLGFHPLTPEPRSPQQPLDSSRDNFHLSLGCPLDLCTVHGRCCLMLTAAGAAWPRLESPPFLLLGMTFSSV